MPSAADRAGFQHLVAEVSLGRAGIVLGLECSRLARDFADWQQLVKICAHAGTLILDEDGLYDPAIFNDRVLLGMKGQISEFELHFLRARMRGGILAKARRGELALALPVGLAYDHHGQVVLDPDAGVRHAVQMLFDTFTATGSAFGVVEAAIERQAVLPAPFSSCYSSSAEDLARLLLARLHRSDIVRVMAGGKTMYRDGRCRNVDEAAIVSQFREVLASLPAR